MFFIHDQQMPPITFVGRPVASRKGLTAFLDAISLLSKTELANGFSVWIAGGNAREAKYIEMLCDAREDLKPLRTQGRLIVWGRVENEALPELYSRSTVVVMPSTREQFGIVAVEAMMCGCPVVASRIGGLQDLIVEDLTGTLCPPNNGAALANALLPYLRNPDLRTWYGGNAARWARSLFSQRAVYQRYVELYLNRLHEPLPLQPDQAARFRHLEIARHRTMLEALLKQPILDIQDVSSSPALGLRLETAHGSVFAKIFGPRPQSQSCLFPIRYTTATSLPAERVASLHWLSEFAFMPRMVASSVEHGAVITEWCDALPGGCAGMDDVRRALRALAEYKPLDDTDADVVALRRALRQLDPSSPRTGIEGVDAAAAALSERIIGVARVTRCHPQVELLRYRDALTSGTWVLPQDLTARVRGVIDLLLAGRELALKTPAFTHGSLKDEHFFQSRRGPALIDFDHCAYRVGPQDAAHYAYDRAVQRTPPSLSEAFSTLELLTRDQEDFYLGVCWLITFFLNREIWRAANGGWGQHRDFLNLMNGVAEAWYHVAADTA